MWTEISIEISGLWALSKYELICLMETKLDDLDQIIINGFTTLTNNRKCKKDRQEV